MTRHTINLGKARIVGINKRSKKAVKIVKEEVEKVENEDVKISDEVNQKIWERGASKPPSKIQVETERTSTGLTVKLAQEKKQSSTSTSEETSEETDYNEIVSKNISEVKEEIEKLENPDYDKLLEAETEGKDRKTLKDHIEDLKEQ